MREFFTAYDQGKRNKSQFIQIMKDCYNEIVANETTSYKAAKFISNYYNLNFSYIQLQNLGLYLASGKHEKQLSVFREFKLI